MPSEGLTLNFASMEEVEEFVAAHFPQDGEFYPFARIKRPNRGWGFFDACHQRPGCWGPKVVLSTEDDIEWED